MLGMLSRIQRHRRWLQVLVECWVRAQTWDQEASGRQRGFERSDDWMRVHQECSGDRRRLDQEASERQRGISSGAVSGCEPLSRRQRGISSGAAIGCRCIERAVAVVAGSWVWTQTWDQEASGRQRGILNGVAKVSAKNTL